MKFNYRFQKLKRSTELEQHFEELCHKVERFEKKPMAVRATFIAGRQSCQVEIYAQGMQEDFRASGEGEDFYQAMDSAVSRFSRQLQKKKAKIKQHKFLEQSKLGRMDQLNEELEILPRGLKKAG